MQEAAALLQWVTSIGFAVLGVVAIADWARHRDRARAWLATALGLLGLIILLGQVRQMVGTAYPSWAGYITSVALIGSGYGLLQFRHQLIPYTRRALVVWTVGAVAIGAMALTLPQSSSSSTARLSTAVLLAAVLYLGYWCAMVAEPAFTLWRASRRRPAVQRARLRSLAVGYGLLVAVFLLLIGVIGALYGSGKATAGNTLNPAITVSFELVLVAAIPALLFSFRPPGWLRRSWRAREEESYRNATRELLLSSPDRATLAGMSVDWARRLIGADGAVILEPDGSVLGSVGLAPELAPMLAAIEPAPGPQAVPGRGDLTAVVALMPMDGGQGRMAVVGGSFSPVFGGEEAERVGEYATSVAVALDRVALVEKLVQSEQQLQEANADLERRVGERTRQLQLSNSELAAINKELEAFSYSVSHDLRAPLRAIAGFARILQEEHGAALDAEAMSYLKDIATNAQEMGELIQDLLELSRLGRQPLEVKDLDPGDAARRALEKLEADREGRKVEVEIADMPHCAADPVLLQLVYQNLLANAIKFTRAREVAHIQVGADANGGPPAYFVRDNGVGFDMTYKDQLFRVFQRLHPHADYEGTGVGLAIVQRVVSRHGGKVWADARQGEGATFYFTLQGGSD